MAEVEFFTWVGQGQCCAAKPTYACAEHARATGPGGMLSHKNVKIWMVWDHFWRAASEDPLVNYYTHNAPTCFESKESEQTQTANAVFSYHLHNSHNNSLDINLNTHVDRGWGYRCFSWGVVLLSKRSVFSAAVCEIQASKHYVELKDKRSCFSQGESLLYNCLLIMLCPQVGCLLGIWKPSIRK